MTKPHFEKILPKPTQLSTEVHEIPTSAENNSPEETIFINSQAEDLVEFSESPESLEVDAVEFTEDALELIGQTINDGALTCSGQSSNFFSLFQPMFDHIPRWKRNLLLHCEFVSATLATALTNKSLVSERIANEMVAIDGLHNGYRYLILPFCEIDDLVMDAVITVSAFHLTLDGAPSDVRIKSLLRDIPTTNCIGNSQLPDANQLYARAILGLQRRRELSNCDQLSKQSILMTILVLLTGAMVTGGPDFPMLFRMLESAFNAIGGETGLGENDLTTFLVPQIHK